MVWDGIVACDLFCAGMGAWTFIFTALACPRAEKARTVRLAGFVVAAASVALGALILAVDAKGGLLHPLRYFNLLGNFGSVMMWGVVLISLFLVGALACIVSLARCRVVPRALELACVALGLGVSLYTGVLLGTSPAFPLWNLAVLPIAFLVSAAYSGYAAYGLIDRFAGGESHDLPAWVRAAGIALPMLLAIAIAALLMVAAGTQGSGAAAANASVSNLVSGSYAAPFWGGVVLVGIVAPLALAAVRLRRENAASWLPLAEWALILVGGFAFRYVVVMGAVPVFA
ncbi:hypothetical protein B5F40_04260 [Gordonibacter sp. An230]|uniref:NrfD/PsrC family molybdoenzyme membrane anchor subunit n=1 Tax=Gordonibacter sp. An230 TaxID=1965592 RepID=UPI000B380D41|nr:NrfD/PsrC family molybdoenzyme membrane anchor subunit [Gordonibacter sp. An230]OUO91324.1 hypothetical protein B5F40_04260 [Gordonibacter sp. An230]